MKQNRLKLIPFLLSLLLIFTACDDDDDKTGPIDNEKPVINTPTLPSSDENTPTKYALGSDLWYTGSFSDNVELKNVTFTLQALKSANGTDDPVWTPEPFIVSLEGKEQALDQQIFTTIPNDIYTGNYQLNIVCVDSSDITSDSKSILIVIE